jgi:hypothetical protein
MQAVGAKVTFGPSRSVNFPRAVAYAKRYFGTTETEPGRFVAMIALLDDRGPYLRLDKLLAMVGSWPTTEVDIAGEIESDRLVRSMTFCASMWLRSRGYCGERWPKGEPYPRCYTCPLMERHRITKAPDYPPSSWAEAPDPWVAAAEADERRRKEHPEA